MKYSLELENLTKVYGKGRTQFRAVSDVNLVVKPGEIVLIMGPSGSGKTTLLTMAGAILRPTKGKVFIAGKELSGLTEKELPKIRREHIGFIFQTFNLLESLSAIENVTVARNISGIKGGKAVEEAAELLSRLGLKERLNFLPKNLSGGEKQRVAVARALINNPDIIFADEPTGNLDSKNGRQVIMLLYNIAKDEGKSVVIVSHDQRIIDVADRVLWLEDGKLYPHSPKVAKYVIDPVCGMRTPQVEAIQHKVGRKNYYFDSPYCLEKFKKTLQKISKKNILHHY